MLDGEERVNSSANSCALHSHSKRLSQNIDECCKYCTMQSLSVLTSPAVEIIQNEVKASGKLSKFDCFNCWNSLSSRSKAKNSTNSNKLFLVKNRMIDKLVKIPKVSIPCKSCFVSIKIFISSPNQINIFLFQRQQKRRKVFIANICVSAPNDLLSSILKHFHRRSLRLWDDWLT